MKSIITLGVLAVVLFTAAAGLSTYLQLQKAAPTDEGKDTAGKRKAKEKEPAEPVAQATPKGGEDVVARVAAEVEKERGKLSAREERLSARERQFEAIIADFRAEREAVEKTRQQLADALKQVLAKSIELDRKSNELEEVRKAIARGETNLKKDTIEVQKSEQANLIKLAALYDSMPPENAAKIFQQMADGGKMDTAVKLIAMMKPTKASKVLTEMADPALAAQLVEKIKNLKPAPTPEG